MAETSVQARDDESQQLGALPSLRMLTRFLSPYKHVMLAAAVALLFTALVTLSLGHGVRLVIDEGFVKDSMDGLTQAIQFLVLIAVLMSIGTFIRFYLVSWLGERVSADIRKAVFNHLITLHPGYFEENQSGEIMSRLTTDTTLLQSIIGSSLSMALRSFLMMIGAIIMLLLTNWVMTLIVVIGVPILLAPMLWFGKKIRSLSRASQDSIADVGSYAGEVIQNIKTVQSFTNEPYERQAFGKEVENAFLVAKRRITQRAVMIAVVILFIFCALAGMMWSGGRDVITGVMSPGDLGAFVFYAMMVGSAFATISEVYGELQRAAGATERLMELLHVPSDINVPDTPETSFSDAVDIHFNQVKFHYPSRPSQWAIDGLDLRVKAGTSMALVGPSGAGKSTLFELLQRFYDPQQGQITIGGKNIRDLTPEDLRKHIAVVPQQPVLFSQNVWKNIRYGNIEASDEQVIAAAKAAYAHDFITALPEGYDSFLGERGVRLSGGQQQRLAIARAILKDPEILLLDEATSALDAESEKQVQLALHEVMQGRTTLIIAHRLATVRDVDNIVVMDNGRLVAQGRHQELLESSELYSRLAKLQFDESRV
jgi:ATP-binding cassette subfamily B protein